ncbi:hypothetical protein CEXT_544121 [Caerostris extrusa]|uniref:Uncharacterized protein n=1 Tax=Caerostris extrusa TaxID=172846 RepID=A0AAV4VHY0_CAEEX|nr:hypothetical protein CEXT_544121 [Caerostris extrusa]
MFLRRRFDYFHRCPRGAGVPHCLESLERLERMNLLRCGCDRFSRGIGHPEIKVTKWLEGIDPLGNDCNRCFRGSTSDYF